MKHYNRQHPGYKGLNLQLKTFEAHRGYSCELNCLHNVWFISKDGFNIGSAQTLTEAKQTIDNLLD